MIGLTHTQVTDMKGDVGGAMGTEWSYRWEVRGSQEDGHRVRGSPGKRRADTTSHKTRLSITG